MTPKLCSVVPWFRSVLGVGALLVILEVANLAAVFCREALRRIESLPATASEFLGMLLGFCAVIVPLVLFEILLPGTDAKRRYRMGAVFWFVSFAVIYLWSKILVKLIAWLAIEPLWVWKPGEIDGFSTASLVMMLAIIMSIWIFDFFYYWFHRAQHHFSVLWRFHSLHHSIRGVNALNSYHHPVEEMMRFPFVTLPLLFLVRIDVQQIVFVSVFISAWGYFIHSDTRVQMGRLGDFLIADNYYHRVHHGISEQYHHGNFAAFLPLWDRMFGTYRRPPRDHLPDVGCRGIRSPRGVIAYLLYPLGKR